MNTWKVTYQKKETIFCVNIAKGTAEAVERHYSKYDWVDVEKASDSDMSEAKRKHIPIVECQ